MFIKLTKDSRSETKLFVNFDRVRKFYDYEDNGQIRTVLVMDYGTELVKDRSEEIMEMLKA